MKNISFSDVLLLLGFCAASYGFWLAWHPLGFILGGAALVVFAMCLERGAALARRKS